MLASVSTLSLVLTHTETMLGVGDEGWAQSSSWPFVSHLAFTNCILFLSPPLSLFDALHAPSARIPFHRYLVFCFFFSKARRTSNEFTDKSRLSFAFTRLEMYLFVVRGLALACPQLNRNPFLLFFFLEVGGYFTFNWRKKVVAGNWKKKKTWKGPHCPHGRSWRCHEDALDYQTGSDTSGTRSFSIAPKQLIT